MSRDKHGRTGTVTPNSHGLAGHLFNRKHFSCKNCQRVFRQEYPNKGRVCTGIVKDPFRQCDLLRLCQRYDNGQEHKQDIAIDEAASLVLAIQGVLANGLAFFYKRPCDGCQQKSEGCGPSAFKGASCSA
ncbi:MAG: hypothetical protein M0Z52_03875 [Actinomycetota bacterium]|nr:hypothetical protein [Actinomycetota bacterium]